MRLRVIFLVLILAVLSQAGPLVIDDAFPSGFGDVVGNRMYFDIQRVSATFTDTTSEIRVDFNYQNPSLRPFSDSGVTLSVGDILFSVGDDVLFGIPLVTHKGPWNGGTVTAGHMYRVNDDETGVVTAREVLGNPRNVQYRPDENVWLYNNRHGSLTDLAAGTVSVARLGDGVTNALYEATIRFASPKEFMSGLHSTGYTLSFASATCGNDVVEGNVHAPEPASFAMIGGGLLLLGLLTRPLRARAARRNRR